MGIVVTKICDVCRCPSKKNVLFRLSVTGKVDDFCKKELAGYWKEQSIDQTIPFGSFFDGLFQAQDNIPKKIKVIDVYFDVCEVCVKKILNALYTASRRNQLKIDEINKMFS